MNIEQEIRLAEESALLELLLAHKLLDDIGAPKTLGDDDAPLSLCGRIVELQRIGGKKIKVMTSDIVEINK